MARRAYLRDTIRELERQLNTLRIEDVEVSKALDLLNEKMTATSSGFEIMIF